MKKMSNGKFINVQYKDIPRIISGLANEQLVQIYHFSDENGTHNEREYDLCEIMLVSEICYELCNPESIARESIGNIRIRKNGHNGFTTSVKILNADETVAYYATLKAKKEIEEMKEAGIELYDMSPDYIIKWADMIKEFRASKANK